MSVLTRLRRRFARRRDDFNWHYDPAPGSGAGGYYDQGAHAAPAAGWDAPTVVYEPHGIDTPETLAEIVAKASAPAAQDPAQTGAQGEPAGAALRVIPAHEPPPMPPSGLSRIMVSQIPAPPPNDRNFEWTHKYADYMRRVGVATGTSTDWENTMTWGMPALEPGDGTGEPL